MLIHKLLAVSH